MICALIVFMLEKRCSDSPIRSLSMSLQKHKVYICSHSEVKSICKYCAEYRSHFETPAQCSYVEPYIFNPTLMSPETMDRRPGV